MTRARLVAGLAMLLALALAPSAMAGCRPFEHEGFGYTLCEARAGDGELRLFLRAPDGDVFGTFGRLERHLEAQGRQVVFAMNAGMYHPDRSPVGLHIENREQVSRLVTSAGPGNFGMLPNGVFCILEEGFALVESRKFAEAPPDCIYATQSGPMLLVDGALHPRFLAASESRFIRNGVGVSDDGGRAYFLISERPVTFHEFARAFRDGLELSQALYLDGNVSRLMAPGIGRADGGRPVGPIVALLAD